MKFITVAATLFLATAANAQGNVCFDAGDCFFSGGNCVKTAGGLLGTCASATTVPPVSSAPAPTPTSGSICFDDFDCFFSGGNCVKSGGFTGFCVAPVSSAVKRFAA